MWHIKVQKKPAQRNTKIEWINTDKSLKNNFSFNYVQKFTLN